MKLSDFDYKLPHGLIAQKPEKRRDQSRLLVLGRGTGNICYKHFYDILDYLKSGDVLVLNNSKVIAARLEGSKEITGGKVEVLLDTPVSDYRWLVLGRGLTSGSRIKFSNSILTCAVEKKVGDRYQALFNISSEEFDCEIDRIGGVPLPQYIKEVKSEKLKVKSIGDYLKERYQTVYARERGSVAAPTAGLHFTEELLKKIKSRGVEIKHLTLHVGSGTFLPVKNDKIEDHKMHREHFSIDAKTYEDIILAKKEGRRIIAVGTTSARVLETVVSNPSRKYPPFGRDLASPIRRAGEPNESTKLRINSGITGIDTKKLKSYNLKPSDVISGWTDIFIYPGYEFKVVDGLITNFHLPKSTLLMLISAFTGRENVTNAYKEAIKKKYRFYSFGDAMLII
ncbi:hypothetical protein A2215_00025 [Candidatus Berkelbacteria bacterium RIFOXYA2_FULL_43_10]|uniref:S-adenosylmethionine:tRNA ribosyltransferase-isomerase n=1 Tax=Candidatus Berkelbacteria bacterium RIFOXYA2_FULL_43_10 TaxID=1797472 RepID=A0A1F5E8U4_9BACT|nr:MAG: hypothetical protein A2215_00025 [Candidatus Berkelbacteria bacterium RIFOXYA2_FULL_43_10]